MKVEIDTKLDSKEEIIAAIRLLQSSLANRQDSAHHGLLDENVLQTRVEEDAGQTFQQRKSPKVEDGYVNFFDSIPTSPSPQSAQSQVLPSAGVANFFDSAESQHQQKSPQHLSLNTSSEEKSFFKEYKEDDNNIKIIPY